MTLMIISQKIRKRSVRRNNWIKWKRISRLAVVCVLKMFHAVLMFVVDWREHTKYGFRQPIIMIIFSFNRPVGRPNCTCHIHSKRKIRWKTMNSFRMEATKKPTDGKRYLKWNLPTYYHYFKRKKGYISPFAMRQKISFTHFHIAYCVTHNYPLIESSGLTVTRAQWFPLFPPSHLLSSLRVFIDLSEYIVGFGIECWRKQENKKLVDAKLI